MLKKRIIKGIVLIIIGLIMCFGNGMESKAAEYHYLSTYAPVKFSQIEADGGEHLQYVSYIHYENANNTDSFFCNMLGYPPILANITEHYESQGSPDISYVTTADKQDKINPQIAYAMSIGVLPENLGGNHNTWTDLQELIWVANRDSDAGDGILNSGANVPTYDASEFTPQEVQRFQQVYEQIFEKTIVKGEPLFRIEDKQSSLFVDQNDGTYIYGPFQLKVNGGASDEVIDYLVMEIMEEGHINYIDYEDGEGYIENFYKFHESIDENFINNGISDGSKKKLSYKYNPANKDENFYSTILVDRNGNPIDFPKVNNRDEENNNFFIKFYPANGGSIINLGKENGGAELFNLKVKYDSYINYKEHTQLCAFYTKGVWAKISFSKLGNMEIPIINESAGTTSNYDIGDIRVRWRRIGDTGINNETTASNPILWQSFLTKITSPYYVVAYQYDGSNSTVISGGKGRHIIGRGDWYYLNDFYSNLRILGFSQKGSGDNAFEGSSEIEIPFDFAGDSDIDLGDSAYAKKDNYGIPIERRMELVGFYGMVKYKANVTYSGSKEKHVYHDPEYDDQGNLVEEGYWEWEGDGSWSDDGTVYKYELTYLDANTIMENLSKVEPDDEADRTAGTYHDMPSAPSDNWYHRYYNPSSSSMSPSEPNWEIEAIYGEGPELNGGSDRDNSGYEELYRRGFHYKNTGEDWYIATAFEDYDGRVELGNAIGQDHTYTFGTGSQVGEYDIWMPKDFSTPQYFSDIHGYNWYMEQKKDMEKLGQGIQSFITFEIEAGHVEYGETHGEGTVFKYGTKIAEEHAALPYLKIAEAFGGNIWKESVGAKKVLERDVDGIYDWENEEAYQGVKVDLYVRDINYKEPQKGDTIKDADILPGRYLTSTFTDENGDYRFYGRVPGVGNENNPLINPLKKYYVKFVYNGQVYAQTLYNVKVNSTDGGYKDNTSKGIDEYRDQFNKRFENIYADSNNYTYTGQRYTGCNGTLTQNYTYTGRAYGLKHVIQEALDNPSYPADRDTFEEQYNLFIKNNTHSTIVTTKEEYQFKHAKGNNLTMPIDEKTGEIVRDNVDEEWDYTPGVPVDYNYTGLAPSVVNYLKDCMIEASTPYTPELEVYGKNIGRTNLQRSFPEQATFNLKDLNRVYMDHYKRWKLVYVGATVTSPPQEGDADARYVVPPELARFIGQQLFPVDTKITIFVSEGEEYFHIEFPAGHGESQTIKVASLNDDFTIDFEDSTMKVASGSHESEPYVPPEPPGPGPGPGPETWQLQYLKWEMEEIDEVRKTEHFYEPPQEDYINLYNKEFDLRHCWSFGVYQRSFNEIELKKDLYKATLVVNGKKEVYTYAGKLENKDVKNEKEGKYNIYKEPLTVNVNQALNGGDPYIREIRKSDYLYDEDVAYGNGKYSKNINAYLTYRIEVRNKGSYAVKINEIVDYYDADNLEFDGIRDENGKLIMEGSEERYGIATHTENIDGQINTSKYTYATNMFDTTGHDPNKEYIGIYNKSKYANGGNDNESYTITNKDSDNNGQPYHLETLYIRGVDNNGNSTGIPSVGMDEQEQDLLIDKLETDQLITIMITFKVKNYSVDNRISLFANHIKLDQITKDFASTLPTVGKNNFAEINSYATYYQSEIPEDAPVEEKNSYRPYGEGRIVYGNGKAIYKDVQGRDVGEEKNPDICIAGVVDVYSNPGSFTDRDVEVVYSEDGQYKDIQFKDYSYRKITRSYPKLNKDDPAEESLLPFENDTDKAPTIRLILDDTETRKISGYVFEDNRGVTSDGSPIGNGEFKDGDTVINGVTVQLVELIQDVDYDGTFTGQYIGEKVWDECEYTGKTDAKNQLKGNSENQGVDYYSGKGNVKFILNSTNGLTMLYENPEDIAKINQEETAEGDGKYCFAGIPSGDFVVRFLYGDTVRTALTDGTENNSSETATGQLGLKETAEVNRLLETVRDTENEAPYVGLNKKSYNGQDYKSTVYQRKLNSNGTISYDVNQNAISYKMKGNNEVKGYVDTSNQDYASTYNYNTSSLRTKEELYKSDIDITNNVGPLIYSAGQPINNSGNLVTSKNGLGQSPRNDIANSYGSMWRYDRVATEDKTLLSDANDLYGYRQRGIDYAQGYTTGVTEEDKTLLNYRAEVLSSFERVTSQENEEGKPNAKVQKDMVNELIENTYMVAQSGIISMNNEYEGIDDNDQRIRHGNVDNLTSLHMVSGMLDDGKTHENHARGVDLGLVERPRAQVKLTKYISNVDIKLADGQTLFNANTQTKDLIFTPHSTSEIKYTGPVLEHARVVLDAQDRPEIVSAQIDDEIMNGATINVTYHLQVENVGEIDYLDRDFYYYGKKSAAATEPVRTKVVRVIDYVANDISYDASRQNEDAHWDVYKPSEVINSRITDIEYNNDKIEDITDTESFADYVASNDGTNIIRIDTPRTKTGQFYDKVNRDYVTRTYAKEVDTYNTIVVTKDMNDKLLPTLYVNNHSAAEGQNTDDTTLILTTSITASGNSEDLTYNNMAEIIETSNPYGRRMEISISGNQEMASQHINDGGASATENHHEFSSSKIVQPREIDADSAQQLQIMPPTGSPEYRNKVLTIITTVIATIIVLIGAIIIKKKVYDK